MAVKRKLNEEECILLNRGACDFSFKPYMMSSFINVKANGISSVVGLPINVGLLKNSIMSDVGLQRKFDSCELYVEDSTIMSYLGYGTEISDLIKTYDETVKLVDGNASELESYLNDLMDEDNEKEAKVMIDMIEKVAIDIKLSDMVKIDMISEYTGRLLGEVLEAVKDEAPKSTKKKATNKKGIKFEQ